jgi:thiol-disulfide isomerase/thioredoxin
VFTISHRINQMMTIAEVFHKNKREFLEWGVIILIGATLYLTGYHTEVIGKTQSLLLYSGIMQPDVSNSNLPIEDASYDLQYIDAEGNLHTLSEHQGKTIFLNFWATWCPPCIAEMPDINDLHGEIGNDVVFVMVSLDRDANKAWNYVARKEFKFPVYQMVGQMPAQYATGSIPTTIVISPSGKIEVRKEGMAKYNTDRFKKFILAL